MNGPTAIALEIGWCVGQAGTQIVWLCECGATLFAEPDEGARRTESNGDDDEWCSRVSVYACVYVCMYKRASTAELSASGLTFRSKVAHECK